jgi:hypothetical protein
MTTETNFNPPRSYWSRNWKWIVPLGCLSVFGCCCGGVGMTVFFIFGALKQSDVYVRAVDTARNDAEVIKELGQPIEPGWWLSGNVNSNGARGDANLMIPLSGPKSGGSLIVRARKRDGKWIFQELKVKPDGADAPLIDLLGDGAAGGTDDAEDEPGEETWEAPEDAKP